MLGLLSHIRVLDLSRVLAGPWASQILADLGAEVIKVERPQSGDDTRTWGPPYHKDVQGNETGESGYFLAANRGKRSITLDLSKAEAQDIIRKLVKDCDVLLENFKVGTLERLGLGYKELSAINPRLVFCSITGFGQTGPRRAEPAYDFLVQAMGGMMSVTGKPDDEAGGGPEKVGLPIIDMVTGVYAAVGVLAALSARDQSGVGDHIDLAMLDVQVGLLANQGMNYLLTGKTPQRHGNGHANIMPQQVFKCLDGDVVLAVGNDLQFGKLCRALGRAELATDPRFALNPERVRHRDLLLDILRQEFSAYQRSEIAATLVQAGVPCGPINTIPEVFEEPQVQHRQMLRHLPHPAGGTVPQIMNPLRFVRASAKSDSLPPALGQHTQEILSAIGIPAAEWDSLRQRGVI